MPNQLYILHLLIYPYLKIGSTSNFEKRVSNYITSCPHFDNTSHKIWLFNIIKSKYNCYQLDFIINKLSSLYSYPYKKFNGSGGTEFYCVETYEKLCDFLTKLDIKFKCTSIDVDDLRSKVKIYTKKESRECEDEDEVMLQSITDLELTEIEKKLNLKITFTLKDYQIIFRNAVKNFTSRLNHIIVSPTGTGKTVAFTSIVCDDIIKNKKHIIIVSKRKEILRQMPERIANYIRLFIKNNIVPKTKCGITNLLDDCSTNDFNEKYERLQIFIVNWDKFTSSSKTDYKKINWNNFSLMIIDESHWVGSNVIHEMMTWIKQNTKLNYLGFSATPIRFNRFNQVKTLEVFGDGSEYNILSEYSYYSALTNKAICPIKYTPIEISYTDLIEDVGDDDNEENNDKIPYKILSPDAYDKVWKQINKNIISKLHFKRGILWFRSRLDMLNFYNEMKDKIIGFKLFPTMSINSKENKEMTKLIKASGLKETDFSSAIDNFLNHDTKTILLSVLRATEGFDDDRVEFGIRMYHSETIDPLNESQRMGRFNRWYKNDPNEVKKCGYFGSLEISDNKEELRKSLIQRFRSWITFAKTYGKSYEFDGMKKQKDEDEENKKLIELYIDKDLLKLYEIDIQKDIIDAYKTLEFDKYKIKNALKLYNSKQETKINTKSLYDSWALIYGYPISDELEEKGFSDYTWLFDMKTKDYLSWNELKKLCKDYQGEYNELMPNKIYEIMLKEKNYLPPVSMLNQIYKEYQSMRNLFSLSL